MLLCIFVTCPLTAATRSQEEQKADLIIESVYHNQEIDKVLSMPVRLEKISHLFLKKPYFLGALGEGISGQYDQFPLYRVDAFDCLTFVETVLALAEGDSLHSFQHFIKKIRYQDGRVSFITRNHFTDLDWNLNNQRNGFLKDVTATIHNEHQQSVAKIAEALINKSSWYQHLSKNRIRLVGSDPSEQMKRLKALKAEGQALLPQKVAIPYIPFSALFDHHAKPNQYLFHQIPEGAIVEIVRPNWNLSKVIGTNMNVSHLGFAFWRGEELMFRNASTLKGFVVDQPLIDYLRVALLESPTIQGINIQIVKRPPEV